MHSLIYEALQILSKRHLRKEVEKEVEKKLDKKVHLNGEVQDTKQGS